MSRIGKKQIVVPEKVEVTISGQSVKVKGPKGEMKAELVDDVSISQQGKTLILKAVDESRAAKSMWGTARTLVSNMVIGVSEGFTKSLEFNGVGYKASVSGNTLTLSLGYSHTIDYSLPTGIQAKVNKNVIDISGSDKELIGQVAAEIRSYRPPEPYKGKGLKYLDEVIIRKAGKTGAKK